MTAILDVRLLRFCSISRYLSKIDKKNPLFYMPKLQNNEKNLTKYEFLITFVHKIESLTANYIFHKINADVTQLVSKDVFIIEEQLYKCLSQLVKRKNGSPNEVSTNEERTAIVCNF